jgi:hypothetical protein
MSTVAACIDFLWPRHAAGKEIARAAGASLRTAKRIQATKRVSRRVSDRFWAAVDRQLAYHERRARELRAQIQEARNAAPPVAARDGSGGAPGPQSAEGERG